MGRFFFYKNTFAKGYPQYLWSFSHTTMIIVKYVCHSINFYYIQYDARKFQELPGFYVGLKWCVSCRNLYIRGPPIFKWEF